MQRMASIAGLVCVLTLGACAPETQTAAMPKAPDEEAILEVIDEFFLALAAGDGDALERMFSDDVTTVRAAPETDAPPSYSTGAALIAAYKSGNGIAVVEPYWDPIVLQRKTLAVVWTPYQVSANGSLIHCGIDVFNLSRHGDQWKIDALAYTAEPSACDELLPEDKSAFRPDFPSGD